MKSDFEVSGTHFEKGVFEIQLEKPAPKLLNWILRLGPLPSRMIGMAILVFSFLFSTSRAPSKFMIENGYAQTVEDALKIQQDIGYSIFALAVLFYMTVFFFRKEKMQISFNKSSSILSVEREPFFRFASSLRGHVPFQDIQKIEKIPPGKAPESPHGKVVIHAEKLPKALRSIEFRVLTDEQFEYFPLNIERMLGR